MRVNLKGLQRPKTCLPLLCAALLFSAQAAFAQKKVSISNEKIEERCKDVPLNRRVRITVARFNVTVPTATREFGANMATMLSNSLQNINCYNVLGRLADNEDLKEEIKFGESEYADGSSSPQKGKMKGAQVIVTGEITEYNMQSKKVSYGPVKTGSETLKLGFIIQLRNAETREVYFSHSFNVTGKAGGGTSITIAGGSLGGGSSSNPAEANALEQGLKAAVEFVADRKDAIEAELNSTATSSQN